jgi:CheY-like chemotaxis protein
VSKFDLIRRFLGSNEVRERRVRPRVNAPAGTRMLVIDDSATIVAVMSKMLRTAGYDVLTALDAESGIEIARARQPALVFLDIVLPGMSGFEALRVLRRDPATRHIPVILISGNQLATEQFYSYRIGADDFMKKPFSRAEVFARIERLLDADRIPRRVAPDVPAAAPPAAAAAVTVAAVPPDGVETPAAVASTTPADGLPGGDSVPAPPDAALAAVEAVSDPQAAAPALDRIPG